MAIDMSKNNFPFYDAVQKAAEWLQKGATFHQKFTCENCGSRQTMSTPNKMYTTGQCEECGHVTDITKWGCNFMLVLGGLNGQR